MGYRSWNWCVLDSHADLVAPEVDEVFHYVGEAREGDGMAKVKCARILLKSPQCYVAVSSRFRRGSGLMRMVYLSEMFVRGVCLASQIYG